jgi:hypothetical protein
LGWAAEKNLILVTSWRSEQGCASTAEPVLSLSKDGNDVVKTEAGNNKPCHFDEHGTDCASDAKRNLMEAIFRYAWRIGFLLVPTAASASLVEMT